MTRRLLITADDFGIGPATSAGILELAAVGVVTSTVLLANGPFAADGVRRWERAGRPVELGWHPCLTLDAPMLPAARVPTLTDAGGNFLSLGRFLRRLSLGRVSPFEIEAELGAQYGRYLELVGRPPANVNGHHHVHIFRPVGDALVRVLGEHRPYIRRVCESPRTLCRVPGARAKRLLLSTIGRRRPGGNDELLGITDPQFVRDRRFFARWLGASVGDRVELTCHPGRFDSTLAGRDGSLADGQLARRAIEFERLSDPRFRDAVTAAGFALVPAAGMGDTRLHRILPVPGTASCGRG